MNLTNLTHVTSFCLVCLSDPLKLGYLQWSPIQYDTESNFKNGHHRGQCNTPLRSRR